MAERRSLVEGIAPQLATDRAKEAEFIQAAKSSSADAMQAAATAASGVSFGTRMHPDYATALKRASLQRKLNGHERHTVRAILEEVLEPWLREQGYL